jgi:hypothetical protein
MKHMVRTKIKGDAVGSSDDGRVPNFDNLPPLPACYKQPSAVLEVMENSISKLHSFSGAIAHSGSTMPSLPPSKLASFNCATNHQMILPRTETPCDFNVDHNPDESYLLPDSPPLTSRTVSSESQLMWLFCVPPMRHLPLQADNTAESFTYTNQTSFQGSHHPVQSNMLGANLNDLCFSPLKHTEDFEPLPFWDDNFLCDDFANFINGAIQQVEG